MGLLDTDQSADGSSSADQGFGDAFGGAGTSMLAPYLGQQGLTAARNNALINIGAALLQAGAPSFDPSHKSFGAALGQGLMAGQNAYQNSVSRGLQSAGAAQNLTLGRLNLQRQLMLMRMAGQLAGGDAGSAPGGTSGAPGAATGATGSAPGAPGAPIPLTPGASPSAGAPNATGGPSGGSSAGGFNPLGMPGPLAATMLLTDPSKYLETQAGAFAPTDIQKNIRAAGIDPNSVLGRQMMQDAVAKANYIPPVSLRPGGYMYDPKSGKTTWAPNIPFGGRPVYDQNGNITGVENMPGAANVAQAQAEASAFGKAFAKPVPSYDQNGNPVYANQGNIAASTLNGAQPTTGFPNAPGTPPSAVRPALPPAEAAGATTAGQESAKDWGDDSEAAKGFAPRMFTLNKALTGLQGADTGPGSESVNDMRSFVLAQEPDVLKRAGISPDAAKVASYDEANKYLTQVAIAQAGSMGEGTDAKLAAAISGNASTHISNLAAQDVVRANMGLERMRQAQVLAFNNTGLPASQYSKWAAQFNKKVDPRVFLWDDLPQDKQAIIYRGMNPTQRTSFQTQYGWALQNGYIGQGQ